MKKMIYPTLLSCAFAGTALAGPVTSPKEIIPPPAPCLWTWFVGGSGGYVDGDWNEEMYTLHFGAEIQCPGQCSHAFFLEVGYTEKDETFSYYESTSTQTSTGTEIEFDLHAEIIPITLNYKYECALGGNWNWYVGAGAGVALVDLDATNSEESISFDDTVFYAHIFAGVIYNINESFELSLGARYIFMDDPVLSNIQLVDNQVTLDGDIYYNVDFRINF